MTAPDDIVTAFRDAWMARDAEALAALFAEDANFVNVTGLHWRTRSDIERAHAYALGSFFADTTLKIGRVETRELGAETAIVHARVTLDGQTDRDGAQLGPRRTQFIFVMSRRPEGWICVAAQNTEVVPGAETFAATGDGLQSRDYR